MSSSLISPSASLEPAREGAPEPAFRLPELLAPAGDWECAKAAVENGADAIYFGLERFNARMRAQNFTEGDLPRLMDFLHRRGVKGYVTFNTLVFENEMPEAEQYVRAIISAGVDAAIVQDVGICQLIRQLSPDFPIHVSTQMTVTSLAGIEFARELGCNLVVLARECSLKEIESIQSAQLALRLSTQPSPESERSPEPLPLEVFVHGALCVAYSGQCLTSEALGGRSANRGECAQACRMPYDLVSDGQPVPLGDRRYLLSPQDLAGLELLPELARLGVASLKIEGRLKSPEYVANITRIYRKALDTVAAGVSPAVEPGILPGGEPSETIASSTPGGGTPLSTSGETPAATPVQYEMEMAFSRGLYTGWFRGSNNQKLVHGRFGKKRGVFLGEVTEVRKHGVCVRLEGPLKPGDGVVFDARNPEEPEEGGRVYEIKPAALSSKGHLGPVVLLTFGAGDLNPKRIHVGDKLWKTNDPELDRRLRQSFQGDTPKYRRRLSLEVHGSAGTPLTIIARDENGHTARLDSAMPLVNAQKQPLTPEKLRDQLGRLGGTAFILGQHDSFLQGSVLLPVSELNRLRRELVACLETLRAQPPRWTIREPTHQAEPESHRELGSRPVITPARILNILVRNLAQLEAALGFDPKVLYCDFEDPKKYREAVKLFRASRLSPLQSAVFVAPPRIFKTGEEWILKQVRAAEPDGYLIRNYDHLRFFATDRKIGDYSLNIANHNAAHYFKDRFELERLTASYDLNFAQLEALLKATPPEWFEVTIHQHMPMFHMEHCLFCAFLSKGTDYTNCGRPCDKHDLKLRDRAGAQHPVKADAGCRNTVFNALAQTGAEYVERMVKLGVGQFRIEFANESAEQVVQTIEKYQLLLKGQLSGAQLWRELKVLNQLGVTRGQIGLRG